MLFSSKKIVLSAGNCCAPGVYLYVKHTQRNTRTLLRLTRYERVRMHGASFFRLDFLVAVRRDSAFQEPERAKHPASLAAFRACPLHHDPRRSNNIERGACLLATAPAWSNTPLSWLWCRGRDLVMRSKQVTESEYGAPATAFSRTTHFLDDWVHTYIPKNQGTRTPQPHAVGLVALGCTLWFKSTLRGSSHRQHHIDEYVDYIVTKIVLV